jgi:hypothetical protein
MRILYKSGNSHEQWFTKFRINTRIDGGKEYSWETLDQNIHPLVMGVDEIEACWQVDYRVNLFHVLWANTFGYLLK